MQVQPVVSPDRRFIRLNVTPQIGAASFDPAGAMVESAKQELAYFEEVGFDNVKISVKASNVPLMIEAYRQLAEDPIFWQALANNLWFALGTIPASIAIATPEDGRRAVDMLQGRGVDFIKIQSYVPREAMSAGDTGDTALERQIRSQPEELSRLLSASALTVVASVGCTDSPKAGRAHGGRDPDCGGAVAAGHGLCCDQALRQAPRCQRCRSPHYLPQ